MAINRIILWLGYSLLALATFMAATAICGLLLREFTLAARFGGAVIGFSLLGAILVFCTRLISASESFVEAFWFLISFWLVIPVGVAVPFMFSELNLDFFTAYFEGVSSITTTGASTLDPDIIPKTIHIWRSLMQWAGGVIVATFAVVILAALNLKGTGVHRSLLFTFKKGELFQKLASVSLVIAALYGSISLICFVFLVMSGSSIFQSVCLALTSVSTGGFTPSGEPLDLYVGGIGIFALCISCLLGAGNVAIIWDFARSFNLRNFQRILNNVEHRALFGLVCFLVLIAVFYSDFSHILTIIPEAVFFVTSTGYDQHVLGVEMVPPVILISLALIGGSALSTTGGVKLIRMLLLFRHLETDLDRLTHPSRVVPVKFRSQKLEDSAFLSIWMYFFGFTMVFGLGILLLAGSGLEFSLAVTGSAASVSNMGPLLEATMPASGYDQFSTPQLIISAFLMLIGRIEVLAAIAVLSPRLWRA